MFSYTRLMSEGEQFGWLFGAWLGTVMTKDIDANSCRQQKIRMNTSVILSIHMNAKHYGNTCCTDIFCNITTIFYTLGQNNMS
jgi:hypothetical protein